MKHATHRVAEDAAAAGLDRPGWRRELAFRMRKHFGLKLVGVTAFVGLFFIGYFYLLRHPTGPVTEMPLTALDRLIPFQPAALGAYLSLWLYVGIAPGLMRNLRELIVYGLWVAALCGVGLGFFYFWPTAVPAHSMDGALSLLKGLDAAGNACPSLHVATAMFSAIWIHRLLGDMRAPPALQWLSGAWFLLIVHSTLATKQHVVLDVLAGAPLGIVVALASLRWRPLEPRL